MKTVKKLLILFCSVVMLCSAFPTALAATPGEGRSDLGGWISDGPKAPEVWGHEWAMLGAADSATVVGKYFVIDTSAKLADNTVYDEQLYISLPESGGFRLQSKHEYQQEVEASHAGVFEPKLHNIDLKNDNGAKVLTGSDGTSVKYTETADGFKLQICNTKDKNIVSITNKQISYGYKDGKIVRLRVELPVKADGKETFYQGGERFTASGPSQLGNYNAIAVVGAANWDNFSYVSVPLFHSNRGYSIWFNMMYNGEADIASSNAQKFRVQFDGDKLDFFLWAGTPQENLKKYTGVTGTSGVQEEWAYSYWFGACDTAWNVPSAYGNLIDATEGFMENYGFYPRVIGGEFSVGVSSQALRYQTDRGIIPLAWFMPRSRQLNSSMYQLDLAGMPETPTFDDQGAMTHSGYPYPYVESLYKKGIFKIYSDWWYDGSNPSFMQVIKNRFSHLWDMGVRGAMLDYGEKYSYFGTSFSGLNGDEMHNMNPYYISKSHYEAWTEAMGNNHMLYARAGVSGSQYYTGNFLGDQYGNWDGFNDIRTSMITMGASAHNNTGGDMYSNGGIIRFHDGNREGGEDSYMPDLGMRHAFLSLYSPLMRQHGSDFILPWDNGGISLGQTFGKYVYYRDNILPSIMNTAIDVELNGGAMVEGMMFAYPYQLNLAFNDNQYLFCDDFLVCSITRPYQHNLSVQFPAGSTWYDLHTYKHYEGGTRVTVDAPSAYMPVFVKAGSVKAIDLPDSNILGDEMHPDEQIGQDGIQNDYEETEGPHDALLITAPDDIERENVIYVKDGESKDYHTYDYHKETYLTTPVDETTFTVTSAEASNRETVILLGDTCASVTVDGKELMRMDHVPSYTEGEIGYFMDLTGLTTIAMPKGWKELKLVKGKVDGFEAYTVLADTAAGNNVVDDDPLSTAPMAIGDELTFVIGDDEEVHDIGRIVVKWAADFMTAYDIRYSEDGEEWFDLLGDDEEADNSGEHWWNYQEGTADVDGTITNGNGSFDVINTNIKAKYITIVAQERGDLPVSRAAISGMEVYPVDTYTQPVIPGTDDPIEGEEDDEYDDDEYEEWEEIIVQGGDEGDEDWVDVEDGEEDDDDDDDKKETVKKKKKKIIITSFPTWLIILLIAGGIVLVAGILLFIILILKKKKKKEAEEALAAENAPPTPPLE